MKKSLKLYLGLFAFLLFLFPMNVFALTVNDIKDLLPNSFDVDLKESDSMATGYNPYDNKVSNEIQRIVDQVFEDNGISKEDFMVTFTNDVASKQINFFIYNQNNSDEYISYRVPIKFNNSDDYNARDHQIVKDFINSHEFNKIAYCKLGEDCSSQDIDGFNLKNFVNELSKETDIILYASFSSYGGGPLSSGYINKIDLYVNDICYESVSFERKYVTEIDVPANIVDEEAYVLSKIKNKLVEKEWLSADANLVLNDNIVSTDDDFELGQIKINYIDAIDYELSTNDVYALNSNKGINIWVIRDGSDSNIDLNNITVSIDNKNVEYSYYSNNITLSPSVLNTFSAGRHIIRVVFNDGIGEVPITFDNSIRFNVQISTNIGKREEITNAVTPIIDNILNNREVPGLSDHFWIDRMKNLFYSGFTYVVDVLGGVMDSKYVRSESLLNEVNNYTHILGYMHAYMDIGDGAITYGKVEKLSNQVSLSIDTSKFNDIPAVGNGYTRKYYLLISDGENVIKKEIDRPGDTLTFETSVFSEYAVVCEDTRDQVIINTNVSTDAGEVDQLTNESRNILKDILDGNNVDEMDESLRSVLLNEILNGNTINVELITSILNSDEIQELETIKNKLGEDAKLFGFFDISIVLSSDNGVLGNLTKLKRPISIVLNTTDLINSLPEVEEGYTRVFKVARIHGNEISYLDATLNSDNTLSVESDRYSKYIPYYVDVKNSIIVDEPNPQTGDSIINYMVMLVGSTLGIIVVSKKIA